MQRQDGDQTVQATAPENAIDDDVIDITTIYHPWSTDIDDLNDIDQMTNYKSMKDIRDELCKDTPKKTEINKSSKRHRPVKVTPLESPMGNPQKDKDKDATGTPNTYVFDPNDI